MWFRAYVLSAAAAFFALLTAYLTWVATHGGDGSHGMGAFFAAAVTIAFTASAAAQE